MKLNVSFLKGDNQLNTQSATKIRTNEFSCPHQSGFSLQMDVIEQFNDV